MYKDGRTYRVGRKINKEIIFKNPLELKTQVLTFLLSTKIEKKNKFKMVCTLSCQDKILKLKGIVSLKVPWDVWE